MLTKKFFLPGLIFLIFSFYSCDILMTSHDTIWIENKCGFDIEINLTKSTSNPPAYIPLSNNAFQEFTQLSGGTYHIHVRSSNSHLPAEARKAVNHEIKVLYQDHFIIQWEDNSYKVSPK